MRIVFFGRYGRAVTSKTLEEGGLGGSESALIYMALELRRLGHEVIVFNNCGDQRGDYDGVKYHDVSELNQFIETKTAVDVFMLFRDLDFLKIIGKNAALLGLKKVVYWAHDDQSYLWENKPALAEVGRWLNEFTDRVFAVSKWQASIYIDKFGVSPGKIYETRNGVNLDLFRENIARKPDRLIYSSVPDRGLDLLCEMYPRIRARVPAELYVFSSFKVYGSPETDEKMQEIFARAKTTGIRLMEPVIQRELAKEMQKSYLLLYPNHQATLHPVFAETSCITVLEAQAAGTPVITSDRGALPESVIDRETGIIIPGDPYSNEYQNKFVEATVNLLQGQQLWENFSWNARTRIFSRYSWAGIAKEWEAELSRLVST
ncbi:hypothetical protein A2625_07575 [candidate division WOR-1 bacterium RIFCSPHIGHO2_01_FULL_53_15]|uniref:Glycosyltransferase subfamily 4-like N-terminal domain-containing protein n=1 Tax=candidate division WOR-1 bacterium RIFCSPHIGHO2_01_FULL_53_15 TaxID=1802564 RepID=A0A1F4Q6L4_UNCSA|nr:MAG: hypothetical protein A2625_07575 [candidate division WOR-1 bacterium RIFCSPHIGHO2_01_FULL_53_15]OGC10567.1 MAG: hypothetical protein A3D23_01590 [candidate division WOR-1 bacterium RIFCSPHIGHO2_02_FULL_53_26]